MHFSAQDWKNEKNPAQKIFFIFQEKQLSNSNIKKFLIFSQMKTFLIFLEMEKIHPKKASYISGNGTFLYSRQWSFLDWYFSYISWSNFPSPKSKNNSLLKSFLYFKKWKFLAPSLKNFLYIRKKLTGTENQKFLIFLSSISAKEKGFLYRSKIF